jgi:hypothetical protein
MFGRLELASKWSCSARATAHGMKPDPAFRDRSHDRASHEMIAPKHAVELLATIAGASDTRGISPARVSR